VQGAGLNGLGESRRVASGVMAADLRPARGGGAHPPRVRGKGTGLFCAGIGGEPLPRDARVRTAPPRPQRAVVRPV